MAAMKLVKNLFILILFCTKIEYLVGMRADNEEDNVPDAHIIYDQRQSGKYNIHVVIKDVAIIEMDQNEIVDQNYNDEEEYYYDEEDLTVKPLNIKPSSTASVIPLESSTGDETTPTMQTTMSSLESQNNFPESTEPQLSANLSISKPSLEEGHNNETSDFITLLTTNHTSIDTKSRSKVEPIYAIEEPSPQPRHYIEDLNYNIPADAHSKDSPLPEKTSRTYMNSRIFKVKVHRSHRAPTQITQHKERCLSNQHRDARGICRGKQSSSGKILMKLSFENDTYLSVHQSANKKKNYRRKLIRLSCSLIQTKKN